MAEWSNAPDSKSGLRVTVPGVRIPISPPKRHRKVAQLIAERWGFESAMAGRKGKRSAHARPRLSQATRWPAPAHVSLRSAFAEAGPLVRRSRIPGPSQCRGPEGNPYLSATYARSVDRAFCFRIPPVSRTRRNDPGLIQFLGDSGRVLNTGGTLGTVASLQPLGLMTFPCTRQVPCIFGPNGSKGCMKRLPPKSAAIPFR